MAEDRPLTYASCRRDGECKAIQHERYVMYILLSPVVALGGVWIGGGTVGILLVIIVVVLLLRR
jgi:hypothetical protein